MSTIDQSPIYLTDSELFAVMSAARPLDISDRDTFLRDVAVALANFREIGPDAVYRIAAEVQCRLLGPPDLGRGARIPPGR
jgi:hypothetical protein